MSKTLYSAEIPLGFIKAEFFRERAAAVRSSQSQNVVVEDLLSFSLSSLRDALNKATTPLEVNEIMCGYGRISLDDWLKSLPDDLPISW
jgi:hypothetical protein